MMQTQNPDSKLHEAKSLTISTDNASTHEANRFSFFMANGCATGAKPELNLCDIFIPNNQADVQVSQGRRVDIPAFSLLHHLCEPSSSLDDFHYKRLFTNQLPRPLTTQDDIQKNDESWYHSFLNICSDRDNILSAIFVLAGVGLGVGLSFAPAVHSFVASLLGTSVSSIAVLAIAGALLGVSVILAKHGYNKYQEYKNSNLVSVG